MTFKFGDVSRNLPGKGFATEAAHHQYFYFYYKGKRTQFYTFTSHGKSGDDVGNNIVNSMKRQLGLGTMKQVRELIECTMDKEAYITALIASGGLPKPTDN